MDILVKPVKRRIVKACKGAKVGEHDTNAIIDAVRKI